MKRERLRRMAFGAGALALLVAVFTLYLQSDLAVTLATQLWNCS
jgi:hypothetical protein